MKRKTATARKKKYRTQFVVAFSSYIPAYTHSRALKAKHKIDAQLKNRRKTNHSNTFKMFKMFECAAIFLFLFIFRKTFCGAIKELAFFLLTFHAETNPHSFEIAKSELLLFFILNNNDRTNWIHPLLDRQPTDFLSSSSSFSAVVCCYCVFLCLSLQHPSLTLLTQFKCIRLVH